MSGVASRKNSEKIATASGSAAGSVRPSRLKRAPQRANAVKLLEFLVTPEAQDALAEGNYEYPARPGVAIAAVVNSWGPFKADSINLAKLGELNPEAVRIADRAGWR